MPYSLSDFGEVEKSARVDLPNVLPGKVIQGLPDMLQERLDSVGGGKFNDASRQDSSDITALFKCGLRPEDVYATFTRSPRGQDAQIRKSGHYDDYLQRTIRNSLSFLGKSLEDFKSIVPKNGNGHSPTTVIVNFSKVRKKKTHEGIHVTLASDIETEKPRWLWENYIPSGKITILAGDPGMGKSTIGIDLVSRISQGSKLPSGGRTLSGTCLIASAEDAPEDTITPRLIASKANLTRVGVIRQVMIDGELHYLSLPRDLNRLRELVMARGVRLLIIDPLNAFLTKGTDTYKDQDVRSVLAPLEDLAEETGVAILIIAHLTKKEEGAVLYRVGGSIGLVGAARSVLAVSSTPKKDVKVLYSLKSNLARKPPALSYETRSTRRTREEDSQWKGEKIIDSSRIQWRGEVEFDPAKGMVLASDKTQSEAEDFLRQVLVDAEVNCNEIFREARKAGISRSALVHTKTAIGIRSKKMSSGEWSWSLP